MGFLFKIYFEQTDYFDVSEPKPVNQAKHLVCLNRKKRNQAEFSMGIYLQLWNTLFNLNIERNLDVKSQRSWNKLYTANLKDLANILEMAIH